MLNPPPLTKSDTVSDEALLAIYGPTVDPDAEKKLDAALAAHPASGALHEARAYLAWLQADSSTFVSELIAAARDVADPFTDLYLHEIAAAPLTEGERANFASLLESLRDKHPSPAVRALAAEEIANIEEQQGDIDSALALTDSLGFIRDWQMIGGFDNDEGKGFATTYPPENEIKLDATYPGVILPARWRTVPVVDWLGEVPVSELVEPAISVTYLATWVRAEKNTEALLQLTTNEPVIAWVNDQSVAKAQQLRGMSFDNVSVPVTLVSGWNKILLKQAARRGGASIGARLSTPDGTPLNLAVLAKPQVTPTAKNEAKNVTSPLAALNRRGRAEWLQLRYDLHRGLRDVAVTSAKALYERAPGNALFLTGGALALWDGEERELALERVLAVPFARGAVVRAHFHTSKHLWDDASLDIAAAQKTTRDSRLVDQQAAALFEARNQPLERCRAIDDTAARWPDWTWAGREKSACLNTRGYRERSLQIAERLQGQVPGNTGFIERVLTALRGRDEATESALLERLRALQPWSQGHLLVSADFERRRGQPEAARAFLQAATKLNPDAPTPYERLGDLSFEERRDDAKTFYAQALERDPKNAALSERLTTNSDDSGLAKYAPTASAVDAILAKRKDVEIMPGAQIVLLVDDEVEEIAKDGSTHHIATLARLALDEEGRDQLIEHHLVRANRQRLRFAYAVAPDGARQEAASINDTTVRFRKLDVGSVIVVQEEYWTQPQGFLPNHATGTFFFQGIREQSERPLWKVFTPAGEKLNLLIRGDIKHTTKEVDGKTLHEFSAHHVAPLQPEPLMPPAANLMWQVEMSTVSDWDEFVRWERSLLVEAYRSAPEVKALAESLVADKKTPRAKLDALYAYVARKVRYQQDYETNIAGVKPHACPVVLERGYGDCKDKALLLIGLADAVGLDLRFALLRTRNAGDAQKEVPNQQFNHAIVYVPAQTGIATAEFMDPTADELDFGNLPPDDQGALSLVFHPLKGDFQFITIPFRPGSEEAQTADINIEVKSDSAATAKETLTLRGETGVYLRKGLREKKLAEKIYQGIISREFTGGRISESSADNVEDPNKALQLHFALDVSGTLQGDEDQTRLAVPNLFSAGQASTLAERQTPLRLGVAQDAHTKVHVHFAPGLKIVRAPRAFKLEQRCFLATRSVDKKTSELTISIDIQRRCYESPPSEYAELRKVFEQLDQELNDPIAFSHAPK